MTSQHAVRPIRLAAVALVIALLTSLFAATGAQAASLSISGKVTQPDGSAIAGVEVTLYSHDYVSRVKIKKAVVTTSSAGTYTFGSLAAGYYAVGFAAEDGLYAAEYWPGYQNLDWAARIDLSSSMANIDASLEVGGRISGSLTGPGGVTVPGARVGAYRLVRSDWVYEKSLVPSGANYTLGGLSGGTYRLEYSPPPEGPQSSLAVEYWNDKRSFDTAEDVELQRGATVSGKDAVLADSGKIAGTVTGPDGEPLIDAFVAAYSGDSAEYASSIAFTDEHGNYELIGVSAGANRVEFSGPFGPEGSLVPDEKAYVSEWYDDKLSFASANAITVFANETSANRNAQLAASGAPVVNTTPPSISGTPKLGEILTASSGSWVQESVEVKYQWFAGGSAINYEDDSTFVPRAPQLGKTITVEVTGSRIGFEARTASSVATGPVAGGTYTNTAKPRLQNAVRVGDRFSVNSAEWTGGPVTRSNQILIDGVDVPGWTGNYFLITPDMLDKRLSVRETVVSVGYAPASATSDPTAPIIEGTFETRSKPYPGGDAIVGEPLTASPGAWRESGQAKVTMAHAYRWFIDGLLAPGATSQTFTPSAAELGKAITVEVTVSSPGYTSAVSTSNPTPTVVEAGVLPVTPGVAQISGTSRMGGTLTASTYNWQPHGLTFVYEWLADGTTISGASGSTFKPTMAEGGKRISVKMTGSRARYASRFDLSLETAPVVTMTAFGAPQGLESIGKTVETLDLAWTKVEGAVKYRIYYGIGSGKRTKIEVGNVVSATLKGLVPDTKYSVDIAALKSNGTRSAYSPRIAIGTYDLDRPTDLEMTQQTQSSVTLIWDKEHGVPKYRLSYGIGTGARTMVDLGDVSTATIRGLKPGTTYSINIASLANSGRLSDYSPPIIAKTLPFLPPTDLASPGATTSTIDVTWTKTPGAVKYRLYYGIGTGKRTKIEVGDVSGLTIKGLKSKTTYMIDVSALTAEGTRSSYTPRIPVTTG